MVSEIRYLIYGLFDPETGELRYIGQTHQDPKDRLYRHLYDARKVSDKCHRCNWIRSLGDRGLAPSLEVLETWTSQKDLDEAEVWAIAYWRGLGCDLTNTDAGGRGRTPGAKVSDETRAKMSVARKGKKKPIEWRQKIGAANRLRVVKDSTKAKISAGNLGRKHTEATRARMCAAQSGRLGHPHDQATKDLLSQKAKGRKWAEETRLKASRRLGGRPFTDENGTIYQTQREASRVLDISQAHISNILRGKKKSVNGHTFSYLPETQNAS